MKNEIQKFESGLFGQLRGMNIGGEAWLMATDVARRLGYANPQKAIRDHVDDEDKTLNDSFTVTTTIPHSIFLWYLNWITMVSVEPTPFEHSHYFTITFTVRPSLILIMLIPITGALMR